jgi:DNA-binding response OmpR family regulator
MRGDKDRFIEAGCDAYVSKPINTRELPEMVARMLRMRRDAPDIDRGESGPENYDCR